MYVKLKKNRLMYVKINWNLIPRTPYNRVANPLVRTIENYDKMNKWNKDENK